MTDYLILPLVFLCSFLGTELIVWLARTHHWLDRPNHRSSHSEPTPTSGGAAFVVTCLTALLYSYAETSPGFNYLIISALALLVAALGFADDLNGLGILPRIVVQLIVVIGTLALFNVPSIPLPGTFLEPGLLGYPLMLLAFLWFINLYNFMDGLDGLAATETLFISLAILFITLDGSPWEFTMLLLVLSASVAGFLVLNWAPAKVFMGDIGSNFLGFILGVAGLLSTSSGLTNVWVWCILCGVFVVDATYTLFVRILKGETWHQAHRTHAYQLAAVHYGSHRRVVLAVTGINLVWLLPLGWMAHHLPQWGAPLTLVAWLPLYMLVRYIRHAPAFSPDT